MNEIIVKAELQLGRERKEHWSGILDDNFIHFGVLRAAWNMRKAHPFSASEIRTFCRFRGGGRGVIFPQKRGFFEWDFRLVFG